MQTEARQCRNCKQEFTIQQEDFDFYGKIKVPPPTWCSQCRLMRRMCYRNERSLYRRRSDITGEEIISIFSPDSPFKVCESSHWYSNDFDPMEYGQDVDFSKPFLKQFYELSLTVPMPSLRNENTENAEYNNDISDSKNCYLSSRIHVGCENILYGYRCRESADCVDCMQVMKGSDRLYECLECINCHNSAYLSFCRDCSDSLFLYNCRNCVDCFLCTNMRNKRYCYKNEQLSKEEYRKRMEEFDRGSFDAVRGALSEFEGLKLATVRKCSHITNSPGSSGDNLIDCKNCYMCFGVKFSENVRHAVDSLEFKDVMDSYTGGGSELTYETTTVSKTSRSNFSMRVLASYGVEYSYFINASSNIFGCIGLDHKEYCILNKQYDPDSYKKLKARIVEHMNTMPYTDQAGQAYIYGEFFPPEFSFFAYNETVAQEWFPLTKEEAERRGYRWRDPDPKSHDVTVLSDDVPNHIAEVDESILDEILECKHRTECGHGCVSAFKIVPQELRFYKTMNLPLPRLCPNCRHYGRLKQRQPLHLWNGSCQCAGASSENGKHANVAEHFHGSGHCPNEFKTSYSPDRKEIVYCEQCYQAEVA